MRRPLGRIALGTVAGVVLATSAFLQSLSNLTEEGSPVLAARVWPDNDRALARVADHAVNRLGNVRGYHPGALLLRGIRRSFIVGEL